MGMSDDDDPILSHSLPPCPVVGSDLFSPIAHPFADQDNLLVIRLGLDGKTGIIPPLTETMGDPPHQVALKRRDDRNLIIVVGTPFIHLPGEDQATTIGHEHRFIVKGSGEVNLIGDMIVPHREAEIREGVHNHFTRWQKW
jgi:hypothetical protein